MKFAFISAGAPRHGRNLRQQVQEIADEKDWGWETRFYEWDYERKRGYEDLELQEGEWLFSVGQFGNVFQWLDQNGYRRAIALWIGTDILQHHDILSKGIPEPFGAASIHLGDAPHLVQEAAELTGLDVGYLRSIPPRSYYPSPIRRWDSILCYVPNGRDEFFRYDWIKSIAADYPQITFHVLARENDRTTGNIIEHKEIDGEDKQRLFEQCFVYLRPCEHDGVGLTLVELAQSGRHIIHSDPRIPFALLGRSVGELEFQLDRLLERREPPDPEATRYYASHYNREGLAEDLERLRSRLSEDV